VRIDQEDAVHTKSGQLSSPSLAVRPVTTVRDAEAPGNTIVQSILPLCCVEIQAHAASREPGGYPMSARQFLNAIAVALVIGAVVSFSSSASAQAARSSSVLPSGGGQALLDPSDSVLLLLDHQTGLFQTVRDIGIVELRANTTMLAKLATMHGIPVITSASEPDGPGGLTGAIPSVRPDRPGW
jgi:hypothetical protein